METLYRLSYRGSACKGTRASAGLRNPKTSGKRAGPTACAKGPPVLLGLRLSPQPPSGPAPWAVRRELGTCDAGRLVAGQEGHRRSDLLDVACRNWRTAPPG